jgi:hypothetical protein
MIGTLLATYSSFCSSATTKVLQTTGADTPMAANGRQHNHIFLATGILHDLQTASVARNRHPSTGAELRTVTSYHNALYQGNSGEDPWSAIFTTVCTIGL